MKNIETLIKKMIDIHVKDADVYVNNGSLWLIFTEEKKWVIELDNAGNLWYNYHFFYKIFKLISMNVVENQHYITRWVEDALQNGVNNTTGNVIWSDVNVEDILQNGVNNTKEHHSKLVRIVEDTLQNGVKHTHNTVHLLGNANVENVLQNGVKHTYTNYNPQQGWVEETIQNGVKKTIDALSSRLPNPVEGVIRNGIKEVKGLPDMSGELRGYGDYYRSQKTMAKPHSLYVKDVIENGIKEKL